MFFDFLTWFGPPEVRITVFQHLATLKGKILFLVPRTYWKVSLRYMFFYSNDSLGGSSRTIDDLMALPGLILGRKHSDLVKPRHPCLSFLPMDHWFYCVGYLRVHIVVFKTPTRVV